MAYTILPITSEKWPAFEALVEAHNGVFGGCWCMGFHDRSSFGRPYEQRRA